MDICDMILNDKNPSERANIYLEALIQENNMLSKKFIGMVMTSRMTGNMDQMELDELAERIDKVQTCIFFMDIQKKK